MLAEVISPNLTRRDEVNDASLCRTLRMSCLRKSSIKALREMISFWDGRGPSEKKKKGANIIKSKHNCMRVLKPLKLSTNSVRSGTKAQQ